MGEKKTNGGADREKENTKQARKGGRSLYVHIVISDKRSVDCRKDICWVIFELRSDICPPAGLQFES